MIKNKLASINDFHKRAKATLLTKELNSILKGHKFTKPTHHIDLQNDNFKVIVSWRRNWFSLQIKPLTDMDLNTKELLTLLPFKIINSNLPVFYASNRLEAPIQVPESLDEISIKVGKMLRCF
jgi:hypothetical protein